MVSASAVINNVIDVLFIISFRTYLYYNTAEATDTKEEMFYWIPVISSIS